MSQHYLDLARYLRLMPSQWRTRCHWALLDKIHLAGGVSSRLSGTTIAVFPLKGIFAHYKIIVLRCFLQLSVVLVFLDRAVYNGFFCGCIVWPYGILSWKKQGIIQRSSVYVLVASGIKVAGCNQQNALQLHPTSPGAWEKMCGSICQPVSGGTDLLIWATIENITVQHTKSILSLWKETNSGYTPMTQTYQYDI